MMAERQVRIDDKMILWYERATGDRMTARSARSDRMIAQSARSDRMIAQRASVTG
jgi:hypothetical protein